MAPICVGTVQAEPVFLDLDSAVTKTIDIVRQAAAKGVQVLAFPEVWVGGYPWYVPFHRQSELILMLVDQANLGTKCIRIIRFLCKVYRTLSPQGLRAYASHPSRLSGAFDFRSLRLQRER